MSILRPKKEKKHPFFVKRLSEKIPGKREWSKEYSLLLEKARAEGLRHRVPKKLVEEFLESVRLIDQGESLEKVINRLKQKGINDPRMFRVLAERAEKRGE